jgi:hypothetical protein
LKGGANQLPFIPLSHKLTKVADVHIDDIVKYHPEKACGGNLHAWSKNGPWKLFGCVQDNWEIGWRKPKEITGYPGHGYENAFWGSSKPQDALESWKESSKGHNHVILNKDLGPGRKWSAVTWRALGAVARDRYAFAWFGKELDDPRASAKEGIAGQWVSNLGELRIVEKREDKSFYCPALSLPGAFVRLSGSWNETELRLSGTAVRFPQRTRLGDAAAALYVSDHGQTLMGWLQLKYSGSPIDRFRPGLRVAWHLAKHGS